MREGKILVVDDSVINQRILVKTLEQDFDTIRTASDGAVALRLAQEDPQPDCILLDVIMPGLSGYDVCRRLKQDPHTSEIPVLFLTSLAEHTDEIAGFEAGAVDYITKPFVPIIVRSRVRNQVELKRHRDHLDALVRERTKELTQTQAVTIDCLAALAEYRDPESEGHILRTRLYVQELTALAQADEHFTGMLTPHIAEIITNAAPLHDVGKVGVPDSILLKPGRLTKDEFEIMKLHTTYGNGCFTRAEKQLGSNSFLHYAREIAYGHHERWDGTGYPQGLKEEAIPLSARIMAVADVYDALVSRRIYKKPYTHSHSVELICEESGTHFDPNLVRLFLQAQERFRLIARQHAEYNEEREALDQ